MTIPIRVPDQARPPRRRWRRVRNFALIWGFLTFLVSAATCAAIYLATGNLQTTDVQVEVQASPTSEALASTPTPSPTPSEVATEETAPTPDQAAPVPTAFLTPVPTINAAELQGTLPASFEIGVHHTGVFTDDKWTWMRVGKMQWIKLQMRYAQGMDAEAEGWKIQFIHEQGFKVLFGIVGDKDRVLDAGYFQELAAFAAGLAQRGADAIEIWNEPNLDREWPTGRVDPALYTEMLKVSYQAIKAVNPNTMVISGATAPTGFFGGCKEGGCDDDVFYQGMARAGAAQYMDCVGAHYNEGIVSPARDTGDPRNPYPTQYLISNTKRASDPFGNQVPVCYTELGFLTKEGYNSPIPPGFEWAENVTLAQQASWLATAALRLSQETNVRLMIIWNLDYTDFNPDPHGGYAIIRPDSQCPACDSLGAIRP